MYLYNQQKDLHQQIVDFTLSPGIYIPRTPPQVYIVSARSAEPTFLLGPFQHPFRVCSPPFDSAV
jgi:hypothetical protein